MEKRVDVLDTYRSCGALKEGHFRLSSGLHSNQYFQSALVLANPWKADNLGRDLAKKVIEGIGGYPDIVIGPALGAVVVAYIIAQHSFAKAFFAERIDDKFCLRRGFSIPFGKKVLLVEDVITTGGSINQVAELVKSFGGRIVGAACFIDRMKDVLSYPTFSLAKIDAISWTEEDCPLCKEGVPIDIPGSRKL